MPTDIMLAIPTYGLFDANSLQPDPREASRRYEELLAECMKAQGFEYFRRNLDSVGIYSPEAQHPYGTVEWAQTYGLGVSTLRFPQDFLPSGLQGIPAEAFLGPGSDPNSEYLASLDKAEFDAYHLARFGYEYGEGPGDSAGFNAAVRTSDGCQFVATRATSDDATRFRFFDEFALAISDLRIRMQSDERVIEFFDETADCVRDLGLAFRREYELERDLAPLFTQIEREIDQGLAQSPSSDPAVRSAYLADESATKLAKVQEDEIELAVATIQCGGGPDIESEVLQAIEEEYERIFISENASSLSIFQETLLGGADS